VKVIRVSNHDREDLRGDEREVSPSGLSQEEAEALCRSLREDPRRSDDDWYRVVEDGHVLWSFEP
jgi:hypothetical protein